MENHQFKGFFPLTGERFDGPGGGTGRENQRFGNLFGRAPTETGLYRGDAATGKTCKNKQKQCGVSFNTFEIILFFHLKVPNILLFRGVFTFAVNLH